MNFLEAKKIGLPKKKVASIPHEDMDRWLKSVDGLAKDLTNLQDLKAKTKDKIDQIGKKYKKPSDDEHDSEEKSKDKLKSVIKPEEKPKFVPEKPKLIKPEIKKIEKPEIKKLDIKKPDIKKPDVKVNKPIKIEKNKKKLKPEEDEAL